MITIQFSVTKQLPSKLIAYSTLSWASHVDFVLSDGTLLGAVTKGVCKREPHPDTFYARVERYTVDAPNSVLEYAHAQLGKPYDWRGVVNFFDRGRCWEDTDSWFCSELVAYAFKQAECPLIRASAWRTTPGDLLLSTLLVPLNTQADGQEYKDW